MRAVYFMVLGLFAAMMLYATMHLPARGDPDAPLHREVSPTGGKVAGSYYIENAYEDAKTDNIVTVVLADYRSFDTLGEVMVVFSAAMSCYLILRRREDKRNP